MANKKDNRNINAEMEKASLHSSNSKFIFSKIKELLKESKVIIKFEHFKIREIIDEKINQLGRKLKIKIIILINKYIVHRATLL